mgnify:CR=1 FL=1
MFTKSGKEFKSTQDFLRKIQTLYSAIILPPMAVCTIYFIGQMQGMIGLGKASVLGTYLILFGAFILVVYAYYFFVLWVEAAKGRRGRFIKRNSF